jgi:hypothetical protein
LEIIKYSIQIQEDVISHSLELSTLGATKEMNGDNNKGGNLIKSLGSTSQQTSTP